MGGGQFSPIVVAEDPFKLRLGVAAPRVLCPPWDDNLRLVDLLRRTCGEQSE